MKHIKLFEEFLHEEATTSWSKMMKGVKAGGSGPWSLVAIENKKVVMQIIDIKTKDLLPAHFEEMRREHPKAKIHIEDGGGMVVWNEAVGVNEVANPDMSKFKAGQKIKWSSPKGPKEDEIEKVDGIYLKLKSGGTIPYQSVIAEAYKQVPYNVKISGVYKVDDGDAQFTVRVAGFERQGDDTDALYLMDSDSHKKALGSIIVKNKDMISASKGKTVYAQTTTGNDVSIKRIGDL